MFRLASVADSTIGSAGDAHHVELPTEQPTDFRAVAVLALAEPWAQIQAAGVQKRDGGLPVGSRVSRDYG